MENKYCIFCGSEVPDGAKFCSSCGQKQSKLEEPNVEINNAPKKTTIIKDIVIDEDIIDEDVAPKKMEIVEDFSVSDLFGDEDASEINIKNKTFLNNTYDILMERISINKHKKDVEESMEYEEDSDFNEDLSNVNDLEFLDTEESHADEIADYEKRKKTKQQESKVSEGRTSKAKKVESIEDKKIYKIEQSSNKVVEDDYDLYYEDVLPADHGTKNKKKINVRTLLILGGFSIGFIIFFIVLIKVIGSML